MKAREWLRANDYSDVADLIDEVINEWQSEGKKTRRNWWDILAGRKNGEPCVRAGRTFPILRAAQLRQGRTVTESAICRNPDEEIPPVNKLGRWAERDN